MERAWQFLLSAPRAALAPVMMGVAVAVLALLGSTIFLPSREPFNRLMEFLELVLGRSSSRGQQSVPGRRPEPPAA
jgi:hypothetical protein